MATTTPPNLGERYGGALSVGLIIAFLIMLMLPISQMISEGLKSKEKKADVTVIPPPELIETPPPPEEIEEEDKIDELEQEREPPTLEQLELSMNADVSGISGGDFTMPAYDLGGDLNDLIYELSQLTVAPRPINQAMPQYPPELQRNKIEGTVRVTFIVRKDGSVTDPRILNSSNPAFEEPTLRAVRRWRFEPGEKDGEKVSCRVNINIPFNIR